VWGSLFLSWGIDYRIKNEKNRIWKNHFFEF
jgi:hypothetical protein